MSRATDRPVPPPDPRPAPLPDPRAKAGRVSVIIPAYNYAHFIGACLASVVAQDVDDLEIVVVDDGSADGTADVVRSYTGVTYVRQDNQGLPAARNTGIRASSGEYLLFLDADDLLAPRSLGPRREFLQRQPGIAIGVCRNRLFTGLDAGGRPRLAGCWRLPPTALATRLLHFNIAPPHAFLLRREAIAAIGWFDTSLRACEDYDYWLRALSLGYAPAYCPAGHVLYRKHAASMSANATRQWHHDALLHERVFDLLRRRRRLPLGNALAAVLAAYAGLFTTLGRLPPTSSEDRARLLRLVDESLPLLDELAGAFPYRCDVLAQLYLLQLQTAADGSAHALAAIAARREAVLRAASDAFGLTLRPGMRGLARAALSLVSERQAAFIDRYRLARLIARRLLTPAPAPI